MHWLSLVILIQNVLHDCISTQITLLGNAVPTRAQVESLSYLDNFISENLRRHPPVPGIITRKAQTDVRYNNQV